MFKNILIPTDGSSFATYAIDQVAPLIASMPGARVTILVAIATRNIEQSDESEAWLAHENARLYKEAQETLGITSSLFAQKDIPVNRLVVEGDPASEVIANEVSRGGYDLIVMASRGLGATRSERHYLGSVAENVLRKVTVPVLVIPIHSDGRLNLEQGIIK